MSMQFLLKLLRDSINEKLGSRVKKCGIFPQFLLSMAMLLSSL